MLPLIKILAVFILIILMLRRKAGLGATMMVSSAVLGFLFGLGPLPLVKQYAFTLVTQSTMALIAALVLIMVLESVMRRTGMLQAMTDSLFKLPLNPRILIAAIPAIIGFLPSAGGARFSAPLVGQATSGLSYQAEDKVFINYWFRHIWEYSLPIYPGLLLASHFSGIPLSTILIWQWPFTVIWAILGYWYVFRHYRKPDIPGPPDGGSGDGPGETAGLDTMQSLKALMSNTWPLWLAVVLVIARVSIVAAISIILLLLIIQKLYPLRSVWQTLIDPLTARIVFLVWGTMAFKDVLELSGAVNQVSHSITASGVPLLVVVTALPLAVGMLTGLVQACIGVSFPLVMAVVQPNIGYVMLAYVAGVVGVMISPVHLCLILTIEYFKADFMRSYKPLFPPSMLVIVLTLFIFKLSV